jgi:hypothetical protein
MGPLGRALIITGLLLIVAGLVITYLGRIPRLPGDIVIQRPGLTVFIPLGWMVLISVALTLLFAILSRR